MDLLLRLQSQLKASSPRQDEEVATEPQDAFHHQAMIDGLKTRLRLLRRQERADRLPVLIRERREPSNRSGAGGVTETAGA